MERLKRCAIVVTLLIVLSGTVYSQRGPLTTNDYTALRNVNMVGVWALMSPPARPGSAHRVEAYLWLHPDGRLVMRSAANCMLVGIAKWQHDYPYFTIIDRDGSETDMLVMSVPVTRTWGQQIHFDIIEGHWEFISEDVGSEC